MAADGCQCDFLDLPDVALLLVLRFLKLQDVVNISKVSDRIKALCSEASVVRHLRLGDSYLLQEEDLRALVAAGGPGVSTLNLNHCYWLPQRSLQWLVGRCRNLTALHLLECRIKIEPLVTLISGLHKLQALSFSIGTFAHLTRDVFTPAKDTLANLQRLHIYYTSTERSIMGQVMNYLGEHQTLLDHCLNLEQLLIGSTGMAVPELYRPVITAGLHHRKLRDMSITYNIHAGAQMFFYGTLSQLPNAHIEWRTLLMPNVNFEEFSKKKEFLSCFCHVESLESLDVSGSKVTFPTRVIDMQKAVNLKYLNLRSSLVTSRQLKYIATYCTSLTSLNLHACSGVLKKQHVGSDSSGLQTVFQNCPNLRHLNLSGEHHHAHPPYGDTSILPGIRSIKDLHSLSLPTCLLCVEDPVSRAPKRIMTCRPHGSMAPKKRITAAGAVGVFPDADSPQPSTSSGCGGGSSSSSSRSSLRGSPRTCLLQELVTSSPQLTTLELIAVKFTSIFQRNRFINAKIQFETCLETHQVSDADIEAISQLTSLRNLTLAGFSGLSSGRSLEKICSNCRHLDFLSLAHIGGSAAGSTISRALGHCHNLRHLRIEQPMLCLNATFFDALCTCASLERLCIIARNSPIQQPDVLRLVDQVRGLSVMQLFVGGTLTLSKSLSAQLTRRYQKSRPGLNLCIYPLLHAELSDAVSGIPAKHLDELTRFDSRVCLLPPDFERT